MHPEVVSWSLAKLRYKGVCKHDLKSLDISVDEWEILPDDRNKWRSFIKERLRETENLFLGDQRRWMHENILENLIRI